MNTNIKFNAEYFPDAEFREYLEDNFLWEEGQELTPDELDEVTDIYGINKGIKSFKGIEYFPKLEKLYANDTNLTSLDVSKNTELKYLDVEKTKLTELDVRECKKLEYLDVSYTKIEHLDLKENTELEEFYDWGCKINVKKCIKLDEEFFPDKKLREYLAKTERFYDVITESELNELTSLEFDAGEGNGDPYRLCNLRDLDGIEYFQNLEYLYVCRTNVDYLNNEKLPKLRCLYSIENPGVTSVDVSKNPELEKLEITMSNLENIDVINNPKLEKLDLTWTNVKKLDLTNNLELKKLRISETLIENLDLSKNKKLYELDIENCRNLKNLNVSNTQIDDLYLGYYGNSITHLDVSNTKIEDLSVWDCENLKEMKASNVKISELNLENNSELEILDISNTNISDLDVSQCPNLKVLNISGTNIESLDLSKNTKLESLICDNNVEIKKTSVNKSHSR